MVISGAYDHLQVNSLRQAWEVDSALNSDGMKPENSDGDVQSGSMSVELVPPQSDRMSISLKAQAPHIQQLIQDLIKGFLKDIVLEKAFPLPKEKQAMAIYVLMENARCLGLHDIPSQLGHEKKYAKQLAILVRPLSYYGCIL